MSDEQPPADLPPFFAPQPEQPKRVLTPAPSTERSHEAPAPMVVHRTSKSSAAFAFMAGMIITALVVGGMWLYQNHNTITYKVGHNSSVLEKPRDVQSVLANIEPATVAVTVSGGVSEGGSAGTGFIYSSDGYVVTNNHVVEGATGLIEVALSDGRTLKATLLGRDPLEDLAVLKVDAKGLPQAVLGDSKKIVVGDDVIAIGNALALEGGLSVTRGIVSGLNRTIATRRNTVLYGTIQTDAAINQGNSGGPLVNSKGEVIGINTAIAGSTVSESGSVQAQNVGFAIAIDRAKSVIEDLKQGKDRKVAFLGIAAQDVNGRIARELGLKVTQGALVTEIQSGSPASKSALALDDVIVKIGDKKVDSANDMVSAIRERKPGDKVTITYNRAGKERKTEVTLVERPL